MRFALTVTTQRQSSMQRMCNIYVYCNILKCNGI